MHLSKLIVFILTVFLLYSCDPCGNLDCLSSNFDGQFRIVSTTDGKDLVFGPTSIYDKNLIKFYSLKGSDTTYFDYHPANFGNTGYDSILQVRFFPVPDIAYMQLSNGDIDTFKITYSNSDTRCCGTIKEIKNFRLNNAIDIPGDQGTQEIKK